LPILQTQGEGTLDPGTLSGEDREELQKSNIALDVARRSAILDWRAIEPAIASLTEYKEELKMSKVQVEVMDGLNHMEEFTKIDRSLPVMVAFMQSKG